MICISSERENKKNIEITNEKSIGGEKRYEHECKA